VSTFLLLLGISLLGGLYAAKGARKFKTPQVVGYVVVGVAMGPTLLNVLKPDTVEHLDALTEVALAVMGFMIGSELRWKTLKKMGGSIAWIVALEALGALVFVTAGVYLFTHNLAEAILLGALSSATAPAGTVDVLQEYKAKGPLTTTLYAVIGLDDAAALTIFGFAVPLAMIAVNPAEHFSAGTALLRPLMEIGLSLGLGIVLGGLLGLAMRTVHSTAESLVMVLAAIFICVSVALRFDLSLILANMALGATIENWKPTYRRRLGTALDHFTPPLFIAFFVMVGARLSITREMLMTIGPLALLYVFLRSFGKTAGSFLGGSIGKAQPQVKKYVSFGLLSQAGVAIGLAISISNRLIAEGADLGNNDIAALGHNIISIITATTFIVQIIGPSFLRYALMKTGEGTFPRQSTGEP